MKIKMYVHKIRTHILRMHTNKNKQINALKWLPVEWRKIGYGLRNARE